MSKIDGMHNSSTDKMIFWALCKVIMDFALHTLHNQHRSISDHIYNVDNTHDNNTPHSPSEYTQISLGIRQIGQEPLLPTFKGLTPRVSNETKINVLDHILSEECPC